MLVNPYLPENKERLAPIPGTRILRETLGLLGRVLRDPFDPLRVWAVQGVYAPVWGRALGGLRIKVMDQKQFITFINQRDLEVLLDLASPGRYCQWLDKDYVGYDDPEWCGFCADDDDLIDDLYDRELMLRAQLPDGSMLPTGLQLTRRVYLGLDNDMEELLMLVRDADRYGNAPDTQFETVVERWVTVERTPQHLRSNLWHRLN